MTNVNTNETCLITGGAGGIGINVIAYLMEHTPWDVVSLDSFRHKGYRERLSHLLSERQEWEPRIRQLQHDLECPISPQLAEEIGHVGYILHLAAMSDVFVSVENPVYVIRNNVNSTLTILEYARQLEKLKAFNYFSTDESLGPVKAGEAHPEDDPHRPSNAYAASKAACEDICYAYWRSYGIPLFITRTMNNFAPYQSPSKFPVMVQKWLNDGQPVIIHGNEKEIGTRFYIDSRDTADALLYILRQRPPYLHRQGELDEPDIYHIVGERPVSNLEMAQTIAKHMDKKLDYQLVDFHRDNPAHDIHYGLQDNRLRPAWKAPLGLDEGLKQTITWQTNHEEWIQ
jgi:dTDP-glucose 4,6-dehydratase